MTFLVGAINKEERGKKSNTDICADPNFIWSLAILPDFFFLSITFWQVYGSIVFNLLKFLFLLADILLQYTALFQC